MATYTISPDGTVTTFNDANWIKWTNSTSFPARLFRGDPDKKGRFIAAVPAGYVVTFDRPCAVDYYGPPTPRSIEAALKIIDDAKDKLETNGDRWKLAKIKKRLRRFNAKTGSWKPDRC